MAPKLPEPEPEPVEEEEEEEEAEEESSIGSKPRAPGGALAAKKR